MSDEIRAAATRLLDDAYRLGIDDQRAQDIQTVARAALQDEQEDDKDQLIDDLTIERDLALSNADEYAADLHSAEVDIKRLHDGIRRYMADDPPHATDCAITDPYPAHGRCDCGVDEFVRAALSTHGESESSGGG